MARTSSKKGLVTGPQKRQAVFEAAGFKCAACGYQFDHTGSYGFYDEIRGRYRVIGLEVDHIVPRSHGGTSDLSNLQALCNVCNARKGSKH